VRNVQKEGEVAASWLLRSRVDKKTKTTELRKISLQRSLKKEKRYKVFGMFFFVSRLILLESANGQSEQGCLLRGEQVCNADVISNERSDDAKDTSGFSSTKRVVDQSKRITQMGRCMYDSPEVTSEISSGQDEERDGQKAEERNEGDAFTEGDNTAG
jgi:hypothetical protein